MLDTQEDSEQLVSIIYRIDKDGEFYVDALLSNYSERTLDKLSALLASIPTVQFQLQTMGIIKNAFVEDGKKEELEYLLSSVLLKSEKFMKALEEHSGKNEEGGEDIEPCIKPSDMF